MYPLEIKKLKGEKKPVLCYNTGDKMQVGDKIEITSLYANGKLLGYDVQKGHMGTITKIAPSITHNQTKLFIEMNDSYNIILRIRECEGYLSEYSYFRPVIKKPYSENLQIWKNQSKNIKRMDLENIVLDKGEEKVELPESSKEIRRRRSLSKQHRGVEGIIEDIRNHFEIWKSIDPTYAQRLADEMELEEGTEFRKTVLDGLAPFPNQKRKSSRSDGK